MRKTRVSSTLTVYFDGQFWVGMAELVEKDQLRACRVVFGAEPSNEEILDFVLTRWMKLDFSAPIAQEIQHGPADVSNPKRRKRQAAKALQQRSGSTKAQQAISEQREAEAELRKEKASERRALKTRERFEQKTEKRKQKRRGQ